MSDTNTDSKPASPLLRLLRHARAHRKHTRIAAVCSVLNKIFDLAPPVLIGAAIDVVVEKEASFIAKLGIIDVMHQLIALAVVTVLIWMAESVFEFLHNWYWRNLAQTIQHEMRLEAYEHIQNLEMAYHHACIYDWPCLPDELDYL